ncbi:MAG: hypothetical protein WBA99_04585, partial [Nodosilinea sp.]
MAQDRWWLRGQRLRQGMLCDRIDVKRAFPWQGRRGQLVLAFGLGLVLVLLGGLSLHGGSAAIAQTTAPAEEVFFADVVVRGQPVFQVGGLPDTSASDRAGKINRRIAALLSQDTDTGRVTVNVDRDRNLATLQVNERLIMTVTAQDALDFSTDIATLAQRWA